MKKICVFCGSNYGCRPEYTKAAKKLGRLLADQQIGLVYGGAKVGIMGVIADTILDNGANAIGMIPRFLVEKEVAHSEHERKILMAELSDAFIALPGGLGTLEAFFEIVPWAQLGMHKKPCGLLNICGYFKHLIRFLDTAVSEKFLRKEHREMIFRHESPEELIRIFTTYEPPKVNKWMELKN
jgi:uncharacterized protein (TIGR00730 family)